MLEFIWRLPTEASAYPVDWSTAVIFLRTPEGDFPGLGWRDFAIVLMGDWIVGAMLLMDPARRRRGIVNTFFEGPYHFVTAPSDKGTVTLRFFRRTRSGREQTLAPVSLPLIDYADALLRSAEQLLQACRAANFGQMEEIRSLETAVSRLTSLMPR